MISDTLDQPSVESVPDEVLMKHISGGVMTLLLSCTAGIAKDCEPPSMALFMKKRSRRRVAGNLHSGLGGSRPLFSQGRETTRLDGDYRAAACHRPVAAASGLFPCARAYEERVVQESQTPRRDGAEALVLNDLRKFLRKSIRALPRLQREAVELAFFKGLSHREIAAATRAPLGP
jgi:DNA-directed RNA polymerase specialized sigma24 family protein